MSRSRRFITGVASGYSYQALVMITGLWLTPFLLNHLGQHDYGLWLVGLQVLTYLLLADLGIIALLPRTVAYATGRAGGTKAATDLPSTIGQTAVIVLCQTMIVALAAALIWAFLLRTWVDLRGPAGLAMAGFTVLFPFRILGAVLEGLQEQAFVIRVNMMSWGVSTLATVVSVLAGFGLYSLAIGWLLSQTFSAVACAYRLLKHYPEILPRSLPSIRISDAIPQLGKGFWISVTQLNHAFLAGFDILIISKVFGPSFVVPYSCTGKLASVLSNQPLLLMHLAVPGLSELKAGSTKERAYHVTASLSQGMMLLSGVVCCIILTVNKSFVGWWVGPERYVGFTVTALILLQMLVRHFNLTVGYAMFCFGYERRMAITGLLDALVTAAAMLALTPRLGYIGAAAGSIVGVCLVSLPINVTTLARELQVPLVRMVSPHWPWFWRFGLMAASCIVLMKIWIIPYTLMQIAVSAVLVTLFYLAILAQPIMRTRLGSYIRLGMADFLSRFERTRPDLVIK
jgi:O-antigen/teichoic acid export membrane protein